MRILSIDPGQTTGIAMSLDTTTGPRYLTCVATDPESVAQFVVGNRWDVVLLEYFQAVTISKYGLLTTRLCGWVEAICWLHQLQLIKRVPQNRKAFQKAAEDFVHKQGPYHMIHEADALAHLMAWENRSASAQENGDGSRGHSLEGID